MVWLFVLILLLVFAGLVIWAVPGPRLWDARPGKPGAVDPTGNPVPEDAEFHKPPDEGNLL
jgi:hypothetical protein